MSKNIIYKGDDEYVVETNGIEKPIGPNLLELIKSVLLNSLMRLISSLSKILLFIISYASFDNDSSISLLISSK